MLLIICVISVLTSPAAAQEWLLPDARPMEGGTGTVALGTGAFFWVLPERPNPNTPTSDTDPILTLRGAIAPTDRFVIDATLGVGLEDEVFHPLLSFRYNLHQTEKMAVGLWMGGSFYIQGVPPDYGSIEYTLLGLALDMGGEHLRFDGSFPLLSGSYPPGDGLTGWGVLTPSGLGMSEFGISWRAAGHSARLGFLSSITTLDYRYEAARWFAGAGGGYDWLGQGSGSPYPSLLRVEAGWKFGG